MWIKLPASIDEFNLKMIIKNFHLSFKTPLYYLFTIILIIVFLATRLFNISSSLEFFGDIGRDHLALLEWWETGKIPLLGPGISYFSLHSPPIYFYLNFPVFIISGFSPYTTLITLLIIYVSIFLAGVIFLPKKEYRVAVFIVALLVIFQPQYILQTRLPWNPTFTAPFLGIAIFVLLSLKDNYSKIKSIIFSTCLSIALGLSPQSVPPVVILFITSLFLLPHRLRNFLYFFLTTLVIFLPLIIFELRHNLFFISRLIANPITQPFKTDFFNKFSDLLSYIFGINQWDFQSIFIIGLIFLIFILYFIIRWRVKNTIRTDNSKLLFILFYACFFIDYLTPFPAEEHNVFGPSILLFSAIAFLPLRFSLVICGLLLMLWITPLNFNNYFKPGHRTINEMENCAKYICQFERDPIYVSVQAWYIYHKTPEYQFMFTKSGCKVEDITTLPNWSDKMMVVADNETYEHGKTAFNELTLFGKSVVEKEYACENNLKVYILRKTEYTE